MICWVLYDIKADKIRNTAAKLCLKSGLIRVQYSCFVGDLEKSVKDSLGLQLKDLIDEELDKVYIFSMSKNEFRETLLYGQAFDKKYVNGDIKNLLL